MIWSIIVLLSAPLVVIALGHFIYPEYVVLLATGEWLAYLGFYLSYIGAAFSVLALREVKKLSNRYYSKQRMPQLERQIKKILDQLPDLEGKKISEIRSAAFIGEISVIMAQLRKMKITGLEKLVPKTQKANKALDKQRRKADQQSQKVNESQPYWDIRCDLSEIRDALIARSAEEKARL